jgi:hypothetical protein
MRGLIAFVCLLLVSSQEEIEMIPETCAEGDEYCVATDVNDLPKGANTAGRPRDARVDNCQDRHEECKGFLANGECVRNPG